MTASSNRRIGSNHRTWFNRQSSTPGTIPHFLASTAALIDGTAPKVNLSTAQAGGSCSQLSRGWADDMILTAAQSMSTVLGAAPEVAAARAFDLARRVMGLGRKADRVGSGSTTAQPAQAPESTARFDACMEFDRDLDAQAIFCNMALAALRGKSGATHLGLHFGYGRDNGYRGTHQLTSINELARCGLRAESRFEGRGATIRVCVEVDGAWIALVSFKRKGGAGPSERYPDHMQAALLSRGARATATKLSGSVSCRDTGRSVVDFIVSPTPDFAAEFA